MMALAELLASPLAQRWALALVHFLWQGLLVAVLVAVLLKLLRVHRAEIRYAVCLAALAVATACPVMTLALIDAGPELEERAARFPAQFSATSGGPDAGVAKLPASDSAAALPPALPERAHGFAERDSRSSLTAWAARAQRVQPWVVLLWVTGVLVLSVRLLLGAAGVRRLKRQVQPISAELTNSAVRLGRRLGMNRLPPVYASAKVLEATAVGFFRPVVLLPTTWLTGLSPAMLEAVLAHELAHIRRWDLWVNLFQRVVETLLFYHPAVWWLSHQIRLEREKCCDELAVRATQDRIGYVTVLEAVARRRRTERRPALAAGIGSSKLALLNRVRYVLGIAPPGRSIGWWPAGLGAITVPTVIWLVSVLAARAAQEQNEQPPTVLGASRPVLKLDWTADGKTLAVGLEAEEGVSGRKVELWDAETGAVRSDVASGNWELAFSPDGTTLATVHTPSAKTGEVRLWDVQTGALRQTIATDTQPQSTNPAWALAYSGDGKRVACGGYSFRGMELHAEIHVLDVESGTLEQVLTHTASRVGDGGGAIVTCIAFSRDGTMVAAGTQGSETAVKVWDVKTGALKIELAGHDQYVTTVAFSADSKRVASGAWDGTVKVYDTLSGDLQHTLRHADKVRAVAFSPAGNVLASGSRDKTVVLWDVATGELLQTLTGHDSTVTSLAFSSDGNRLASGSWDQSVRIWDVSKVNGTRVNLNLDSPSTPTSRRDVRSQLEAAPNSVTTAKRTQPKGRIPLVQVSTAPRSSKPARTPSNELPSALTDIASRVVAELKVPAKAVAWSPDGKTLAGGDWTVYLWDSENWEVRSSFQLQNSHPVLSLSFAPDGATLATGTGKSHSIPMEVDGQKVFRATVIGEVRIYDSETGRQKLSVENGQNHWVYAVAFSPDGRTLAAGAAYTEMRPDNIARTIGGQLLLVDTLTGGYTDAKSGSKNGWIHSLAYSPDGAMLATVESDVALWDTRTNEIQRRLSHPASSVAFSPDGKLVATGGRDKTVKLWDPKSGELKRSLPHPDDGGEFVPIASVAFSPDGRLLATATAAFVKGTPESIGGAIRLWDVATGEMLHTLDDHAAGVNAVAFSPDGKHLASASDDKTVRVWDLTGLED